MRSDYHFKTVAPDFLRKLDTDFVGGCCVNFTGFERLVSVKALPPSELIVKPLRFHELSRSRFLTCAVQASHIGTGFRFHFIGSILNDTINLMKCCNLSAGFLGCLFRIHRVVDYDVYPAFDRPYRSDCHQLSSGA